MTARTCSDCTGPISRQSKTGRCKTCCVRRLNDDPSFRAKRAAGIRAALADPAARTALSQRARQMNLNPTPAMIAARRALGMTRIDMLREANAGLSPQTRAENGRKRSATVLAWCPPEWRDQYRELKRKGRRAAEAKRVILDLIAGRPAPEKYAQQRGRLAWCPTDRRDEYRAIAKRDGAEEAKRLILADLATIERRRIAALSPFERQEEQLRRGARLVEVRPIRRADPAYSLTGNATGML